MSEAISNSLEKLKQKELITSDDGPSRYNIEEAASQQWAMFKVDNELYGIDVVQVKEVLRYSAITPVPGSDALILGIINLRGNVVTVLDTRQMFGLSEKASDDNTRIIVVEFDEQEVIGLVVDAVDEVIDLPQEAIERAPNIHNEEGSAKFVQGVSYYNSVLIILLDIMKMLVSVTPKEYYDENSNIGASNY